MKPKTLFLIVFILIIITYLFIMAKSSPIFMHYFHLIFFNDENSDKKIICDTFDFKKIGFTKTFILPELKAEIYELSIETERFGVPIEYRFSAILKIDIKCNTTLIESKIITSPIRTNVDQNMKFITSLTLIDFKVPFNGKKEDLEIHITVIEPDKSLVKYKDKIKLCISVSGMI